MSPSFQNLRACGPLSRACPQSQMLRIQITNHTKCVGLVTFTIETS